ncbi:MULTISPECIES: magnesium and cobalt transport protein CorA [Thermomonospora]|uniref:Mg2 transporter protein CorA family protein n=1 Tax=Thermomonospora curvata (strain ATCC 19995 / DSM 43183 / JCM 3096 / KCTC 9072 / NBRC 15933 / NCIMB 10081 / Henssen B9) TaxID=471852 RepID=D1AEI7_THECD|nr:MULTISPECIES: magnesium and cobalt transport protein CorA [Thermomonospora]ACY95803.1 Mg2 transporter protein CorA family protein [Thermomonospora curvata DSM 43183]PKK16058.1 MAG: magnesium transporter CorA [Thermomonospora sp. CIF 1]
MALFRPLARPLRGSAAPAVPPPRSSAVTDWAAYIDGQRVDTETVADAVRLVRDGELTDNDGGMGFVWVGLHEPDAAELERLAPVFGLHPLAVEDAVHAHQRPKLERYDDVQFLVMKTVGYAERGGDDGDLVETGEIMIFCGHDFVVTVRHGPHGDLDAVRRRLEADPARLALGPTAVLHAIADHVVDAYMSVAEAVADDIDRVEEAVFSPERSDEARRIYRLKREVIQLKRAVGPLAGPLRSLAGRRFVPPEIKEYLRDVEDHLTRVREQVESYDELLNPILHAHMTQVTVADNRDMRRISAWGAILMLPTAVTGIYGMNFDNMPALHTEWGYMAVLAVIAVMCLTLYRGFRRNGWL